jgi:hypothetical protein
LASSLLGHLIFGLSCCCHQSTLPFCIPKFLTEKWSSVESDTIVKERLYQAYLRFCNKHNLAILSKESLGKILKKKYQEGRESSGKRETFWKGIKLKEWYKINAKQETLDISDNHESNFSCYYCSYHTKIIKEYEAHVVLKHRNKPAYPGKADLKSLGLLTEGT